MKELFEKTNAEVKKATALIGKMQEPQYMVSPTWSGLGRGEAEDTGDNELVYWQYRKRTLST